MIPVKIDPVWLMHVQKPGRYIGGEWNSIVKKHDAVDVNEHWLFLMYTK